MTKTVDEYFRPAGWFGDGVHTTIITSFVLFEDENFKIVGDFFAPVFDRTVKPLHHTFKEITKLALYHKIRDGLMDELRIDLQDFTYMNVGP